MEVIHSSRHNIFIPFENASKRELDLLDAGNDSMESAVASDDKRWKEWVKSEEPSSDDTGRIHEENTTPAQAVSYGHHVMKSTILF